MDAVASPAAIETVEWLHATAGAGEELASAREVVAAEEAASASNCASSTFEAWRAENRHDPGPAAIWQLRPTTYLNPE